jgi:hypothetical protein
MPSLLWQEAERFHPRPRCCSSSVVEHSLGKGEVESSILSCSTIFPKWFQPLTGQALPLPPLLDLEQNLKDASKPGEISGSRFAICSADLQRAPRRREARLSAPSGLNLPLQPRSRGIGAQSPDTVLRRLPGWAAPAHTSQTGRERSPPVQKDRMD